MQETFKEYIERVSRAKHMLALVYESYHYMSGVSRGYKNSQRYLLTEKNPVAKLHMQRMEGYSRRLAIRAKTKGLIVEDKVLTYREDEL